MSRVGKSPLGGGGYEMSVANMGGLYCPIYYLYILYINDERKTYSFDKKYYRNEQCFRQRKDS